ncbi:MAG: DNA polymerase III subunit epsilon [Gammaproteobacteria bacterium]|nr:DNA polymerase III subunit epsilon [Gammaproteobacteria bacterium]
MRQIVLDTETTGLEVSLGHRIIEIGCVELVNRRVTGNHWHFYVNPDREIDSGAFEVHGISSDFLQDKHRFAELADDFVNYVAGAELVIHNAAFDVGFLDNELALLDPPLAPLKENCTILDTLQLARQKHPGQKNNLDALCKRYDIDNSNRSLHGALLDARILADVYLAMTGGQTSLGLDAGQGANASQQQIEVKRIEIGQPLPLWQADENAQQANRDYIEFLATQHDDPAWK